MSTSPSPWRRLGAVAATVAAVAILAAIPASAQADASPEPPASTEASVPDPSLSAQPSLTPDAPVVHPIPDAVLPVPADIPTVTLEPESGPSLNVGEPVSYALGHCGLLSPIDVDGSLWWPVGGVAPDGGPIASDEGIGELINATEGELLLTSDDEATFTTAGGSVIHLERAPGALDYPLCM